MKARAQWKGRTLAASEHCVLVEGNYYFPPESIESQFFAESEDRSVCPWKGEARYWHVTVHGERNRNAAWHYPDPLRRFQRYRGYVAFWKGVSVETDDRSPAPGPALRSYGTVREQEALYNYLQRVPKVELHLHLEGLTSPETAFELMQRNGARSPGVENLDDLYRKYQVRSLPEFVDLFINVIQPVFRREEDFSLLLEDLRLYLERNNIEHAEIFFAPTKFLQNGLDFAGMLEVLEAGARDVASRNRHHSIKFLIDVSRSYGPENAMCNLELTLKHRTSSVIGIGLGGAESRGPAEDYRRVFERARAEGLHAVAHAGESMGPDSIRAALDIGAEHIGHGVACIEDEALLEELRERRIPLEVCPTSNVFTGARCTSLAGHPVRKLFERGLMVTANTDDPALFGIELAGEFMNLHNHLGFSVDSMEVLLRNAIEASFLQPGEKAARRAHLDVEALRLRERYLADL